MNEPTMHPFTFIQNEVSQWEHAINSQTVDHPDPIELHFRYICWLESHLKTHQGIDERFRKAVEACLTFFDKHEAYKQDLRFVKLWIKYIDFQPNPLNMYKILYQKGIGTKCAAFYNGWAHYYNSSNQFKQAESIYNMGIQLKAEPIGELENAQKNFRFSVAQRMLYNDESSKKRTISSLAEQREQITSLSPHQQNSHPAKRTKLDEYAVNSNVAVAAAGYSNYPTNQQQTYPCGSGTTSSSEMVQASAGYVQQPHHHQPPQQGYSNYQQQQQAPPPPPQPIQEIKYTFEHGFQTPSNFYNYAQNSHEPWDAPLTLDEPFEPNQRVFYPKSRVYPGNKQEYSLEELKTYKWRMQAEEKRKREHEAEQLRMKQEQERLRQEAEAKRLLAEQERIRKEQEKQQQLLQQQQQQQQTYQQQQQYQQSWAQPQQPPQPAANYPAYPQQPTHHQPPVQPIPSHHQTPQAQPAYQNSPQYSYVHDHMYQQSQHHHQYADNSYQSSPQQQQAYQNSPSYHSNTQAYNHQSYNGFQQPPPQQGYQSSPLIHQNYQQSPQPSYVGSPHTQSSYSNSPQIHPVQNHYQPMQSHASSYQSPQISQTYGNHTNQNHYYSTNHYPAQYQSYNQSPHHGYANAQQQHAAYDNNQQNYNNCQPNDGYQVEYLDSDQNEIDPNMLQQPIVENGTATAATAPAAKPTVQSYMLDDLEDQIEASTIRFSSDGVSRDKKLTIKFRKEKSTNQMKIVNSDQSSCEVKDPLELPASSKRKSAKSRVNNDMLDESTQFMPSATNSSSSLANPAEFDSFSGKLNFNGCVTPGRKSTSKLSTPVSTFKSLRKAESVRSQNDDSVCSFNGDQNSFFEAENDEEFRGKRLETALASIEEHLKREKKLDPFNAELCRSFLVKLNFPNRDCKDYKISNSNLPKLIKNQTGHYAGIAYHIEKEVGRGAFGAVFRGVNTTDGNVVALKYQKPPNSWELYICTEVRKRLKNPDILPGFMTISAAVLAPNASVLISEFSQYGSLLDINNKVRQATTKVMHESLVMHFTSQILNITHYLHSCKIIHADIKPDNFLLMTLPSADTWVPSIRLIDFGCAIDMTLFEEGTEFYKIIQTDGFTCTEMQEGKSWTYQTDLFCVCATVHVLLFGEYMQVNKKFGSWEIKQKFPRYLNKTVWGEFFPKLLNIPDKDNLPNLMDLKRLVDNETNENELTKHIRTVSNLIRKR